MTHPAQQASWDKLARLTSERAAARRAAYFRLRDAGLNRSQAADQIGITVRRAQAYEREAAKRYPVDAEILARRLRPTAIRHLKLAWQRHRERAAGRREDYFWLREQGHSREQAAERVGVTVRTVERYEQHARTHLQEN